MTPNAHAGMGKTPGLSKPRQFDRLANPKPLMKALYESH
jgi:hypothetical protein